MLTMNSLIDVQGYVCKEDLRGFSQAFFPRGDSMHPWALGFSAE